MEQIHHFPEVIRCTMTGSRCKITGYLIAPRPIERILCQWHEFHMRIRHFFQIRNDFRSKFQITRELFPFLVFPRAKMHFIDIHGFFVWNPFFSLLHPCGIFPLITAFKQFGSRTGTSFKMHSIRVRLFQNLSILCFDTVFIEVKLL